MKTLIFLLLSISISTFGATYTEFYINNAGGGNTNSGHTADASPTFAAQDGFWTNYTGYGVFFKAGMTLTSVTNGAWAAVYTNDSTATAFVGIITNVDDAGDFIWVKTVEAKGGTAPTQDDLNGKTHITVGGAWLGPGMYNWNVGTGIASNTFPTALVAATMTNGPNIIPCINIKGGTTYEVTNAMTISGAGPSRWQGYTTSVRDGGKATLKGWDVGASFILLTASGANLDFADLIFGIAGNSGSAASTLNANGTACTWHRIVVHDSYRSGFAVNKLSILSECETYSCNKQNLAGNSGFALASAGIIAIRCIAHDNTGSNNDGWNIQTASTIISCIADSNGKNGFTISAPTALFIGCDSYANVGAGLDFTLATVGSYDVQNCNFITNGTYGITSSGSAIRTGTIENCGFGSGTMTNASGSFGVNLGAILQSGNITYATDAIPWVDAPNGDFRINLTAAKAAGRGSFTETAASYSGTEAYPSIGAGQPAATNAATAGGAYTFAQ